MFFFDKQKTAYEMRIRDWSADVCSSELSLSIHSSVSAYLHTALKNKAINSRKRKDRNICIDEAELSNLQADSFTSTDRLLMAKEFDKQIQHYIDLLHQRCRMIFLLNRDNKLSYQAIAQLINASLNTVKPKILCALSFLLLFLITNKQIRISK